MAGFGNGAGNNPSVIPNIPTQPQLPVVPQVTPVNGPRVTLDTLITRLGNIPQGQAYIDVLRQLQLDPTQDPSRIIPQLETMFGEIHNIPDAEFPQRDILIWNQIGEIMRLYGEYDTVRQNIINSTHLSSDALISDEFLDNPVLFGQSILDQLEASEGLNLAELIAATKSIELLGYVNGTSSWDSFFDDLRSQIPPSQLAQFDAEVALFKQEFAELYNQQIDTSSIGSSLGEQMDAIESGSRDLDFQSPEGVKIQIDTMGMLGSFANSVGAGELFGLAGIDIGDAKMEVGPFYDKESAVRTIYKIKLMLNQLEVQGSNLLATYYMSVLGYTATGAVTGGRLIMPFDNYGSGFWPLDVVGGGLVLLLTLIGSVVAAAAPVGIPAFFALAPLESGWRRIQDRISLWLGDKGWGESLLKVGNVTGGASSKLWSWTKDGTFMRNFPIIGGRIPDFAARAVTLGLYIPVKATDVVIGGAGSLLKSAELRHLDAANLLTDKVLLLDGISGDTGNTGLDNATGDAAIEVRSRFKILALYERIFTYQGDAISLKELENIRSRSLFTNSESFYIDMHRLLNGKLSDPSWRAMWTRIGIDATNIFTLPNKKEGVVTLYLKTIGDISGMLGNIYKGVSYDASNRTGVVKIPENREDNYTDDIKKIIADIDFSLIDDTEEKARQDLFKELVTAIETGKAGTLTKDELQMEIRKITDGYLPKFKTIELVLEEIKNRSGNPVALQNLEIFRRMVLSNTWYGTLGDLSVIFTNIDTVSPINENPTLRTFDEIKNEGDKLQGLGLRGNANFSQITDINTYKSDLALVDELMRSGAMPRGSIRDIERELKLLLDSARDTTEKIDYTIPEINYAISQILSGKRFADRGDGRYGDTTMDINRMLVEYDRFDTKVNDILETRLITSLQTKPESEQRVFIKRIEGNVNFAALRGLQGYKDIVAAILPGVNTEIGNHKTQVDQLRERANAAMRTFSGSSKISDGPTSIVTNKNTFVASQIQALEVIINTVLRSDAPIIDKLNFLNGVNLDITTLISSVGDLETEITNYNATHLRITPTPGPTPVPDPTPVPLDVIPEGNESRRSINERSYRFLERVLLENLLRGGDSVKDEGFYREVQRAIRSSTTLNSGNYEQEVFDIVQRVVNLRGIDMNLIPASISEVRELGVIHTDISNINRANTVLLDQMSQALELGRGGKQFFDFILKEFHGGRIIRSIS